MAEASLFRRGGYTAVDRATQSVSIDEARGYAATTARWTADQEAGGGAKETGDAGRVREEAERTAEEEEAGGGVEKAKRAGEAEEAAGTGGAEEGGKAGTEGIEERTGRRVEEDSKRSRGCDEEAKRGRD